MGRLRERWSIVGFAVVVLCTWVEPVTPTTLPPRPHLTTPPTTPEVMTEAPPPRPADLVMVRPKDCTVYVLGVLHTIKKHGETWLNDGSDCELCECAYGQKRCYYHYCNVGLSEVFMTPPSGRPPLDDEDNEDDLPEGSGHMLPPPPPPPPRDDLYKYYHKGTSGAPPGGLLSTRAGENDTRPPAFCVSPCKKACPWGYKMDELQQCRKCSCRKRCPSLSQCRLQCLEGLATDRHGCHVCRCRSQGHDGGGADHRDPPCNETSVRGCVDGASTHEVGEVWTRGACVSCRCVVDGYTECNITQCPTPAPCNSHSSATAPDATAASHTCCPPCQDPDSRNEVTQGPVEVSLWSLEDRGATYPPAEPSQRSSQPANDGTVKSAVQASGVQWWQVWLVMVPLALLFLLVAVLMLRYWRRNHRDKYDINAYRPAASEKLKPVTTADDHLKVRHI